MATVRTPRLRRLPVLLGFWLTAAVLGPPLLPEPLAAHEVPARVTVRAFVKADGDRLLLLVRVPLESIRDIEFPLYGPGYLDISRTGPLLEAAARLWIADYVELYESGVRLAGERIVATRVSLPSDASFRAWSTALEHVTGAPLPAETQLMWQQGLLDVLIEYPITSEHSDFAIRPALAHLGLTTATVLRFLPADGAERAFQYVGDPGLVRLDPRWHQAALSFVKLGFRHILGGLDHLLFILCLVIPFRRLRPLVLIVTAFTVAHSITLIAAALGLAPGRLWFPPLIETLIAASIVFMALENIVGARLERRWAFAFGFGLVHGFGFSFLLRDSLQFAGAHMATSLLAFNVGVELGQIAVLLVVVPALSLLFSRAVPERVGVIVLSALIAHTAWHWMTARGGELFQYSAAWPALDAALLASAVGWLMVLLVAGAAAWLLVALQARLTSAGRAAPGRPCAEPRPDV
ncbi:MAG: HupE/UreJ family protein [Gemmatimonadota bacterium]